MVGSSNMNKLALRRDSRAQRRINIPRVAMKTLLILSCLFLSTLRAASAAEWEILDPHGRPHARHEAAFVECDGKFYLLGGRRIQPVDIYDPKTNTWTEGKAPPIEVHHFQPVVWRNRIILAGAMTGKYPRETALPRVLIYDPGMDTWTHGAEIPADRQRGGAGTVIVDEKLYLVAGIINGHWDGHVAWLDAFDLNTGEWTQLPDAPHQRDHFQAGAMAGKIYAAGGRRSSAKTKETFNLLEPALDIYDIAAQTWRTADEPLPHPRAGSFSLTHDGHYLVAGGESHLQPDAYANVDAYVPALGKWIALPSFARGRHGAGIILHNHALWTCGGSGSLGGSPELDSLERLSPYR